MMNALAYCPVCRKDVEFKTEDSTATTTLEGVDYSYPIKDAICSVCGAIATYPPFQEEAGMAFSDAVRTANDIVSLKVVRDMPKRYCIGKRPLSLLLEWGEITYSRFMEGAVPSRDYSDIIKKYYDDPMAFYQLLKAGRNRIKDVTFRKSSAALKAILEDSYPEAVRIYEIAELFSALANWDITNMALQKLVYLAQAFSLVLREQPLFMQEPRAWAAGPVYGQLWHEIRDNAEAFFSPHELESPFAQDEEEFIKAIYDAFGKYSGPTLSEMTHKEAPWVEARKRAGVPEGEQSSEPITLESMKKYFEGVVEKYGIHSLSEIAKYPTAVLGC